MNNQQEGSKFVIPERPSPATDTLHQPEHGPDWEKIAADVEASKEAAQQRVAGQAPVLEESVAEKKPKV